MILWAIPALLFVLSLVAVGAVAWMVITGWSGNDGPVDDP